MFPAEYLSWKREGKEDLQLPTFLTVFLYGHAYVSENSLPLYSCMREVTFYFSFLKFQNRMSTFDLEANTPAAEKLSLSHAKQ